ncbi:helix-turn-helix domain-containing protein [Streptomyces nymphaeiformis]|jgi:transcriptional regulator with XRE-family HTH domain|uniref:Transcriptional regulator with XRE-family HTH domain n=1 Tax=Streptomyces nymphaeiformis TaxID=2663842 RepID=A0A7W7UA87_9ACTN|nr:helix-turn-helix transcriptional regulator [Streptomyces nymphaeiformis]MBB4987461.1 transcriptional regulator with XRE-family HTH domain [Streptomyces nymphaeiformis]
MLNRTVDGRKVRDLRRRRGLSVVAVAEAAGCSKWMIYKIETGANQPSPRVYAGMRDVLKATESQLLRGRRAR